MFSKKQYQVMIRKVTSVEGGINGTLKSVLETSIMSVDFQHDIMLSLHQDCSQHDEESLESIMPGEVHHLYVKVDPNELILNVERLEVETFKQMGRYGLEFIFIAGGVEKYDKLFARFVSIGETVCIEFVPMSQVRYLNGDATFYVSGILVIGSSSGTRLRRLEQQVRRRGLQGAASNQEAEVTVTLLDPLQPEQGVSFSSEESENQMQSKKFPFVATMAVVASVVITAALIVLGIVVHAAQSSAASATSPTSKQ